MYRDPNIAERDKEIARLRDELHKSKDVVNALQKQKGQTQAPPSSPIPEPPARKRFSRTKRFAKNFGRMDPITKAFFVLVIVCLFVVCQQTIQHTFFDIREGYVTNREHHPAQRICEYNHVQHRVVCRTQPDYWTVELTEKENTAIWNVTRAEYNSTTVGQWFCYVDFNHPASECHGPPHKNDFTDDWPGDLFEEELGE